MLAEINEQVNTHPTLLGKVLGGITVGMFLTAEVLLAGANPAQIFAWIGTGVAGFGTGIYWIHRAYLNHKNKKSDEHTNKP